MVHTTDHEEIRTWVDEHAGKPALVKNDTKGEDSESLTLIFENPVYGERAIDWVEFFDIFETRGLRMHFDSESSREDAPLNFGFESRLEAVDGMDDETELPEDIEDVEENMFPSAPADGIDESYTL